MVHEGDSYYWAGCERVDYGAVRRGDAFYPMTCELSNKKSDEEFKEGYSYSYGEKPPKIKNLGPLESLTMKESLCIIGKYAGTFLFMGTILSVLGNEGINKTEQIKYALKMGVLAGFVGLVYGSSSVLSNKICKLVKNKIRKRRVDVVLNHRKL